MPIFIGIDYGHGETTAAQFRPTINDISRLEDLEIFPGKKKIFSVIAKINRNNNEPKYIIGDEAVAINIIEAEDYCVCFKRDVSQLNDNERHKVFLGHFMQQVFDKVYSNIPKNDINNEYKVYIACPTEWHKSRAIVESYKQHALNYGVPVNHVFMESAAAYYRLREKKMVEGGIVIGQYRGVLVIDFGSSTVDLTFFNQIDTPINKGYPYGASKVENIILQYILEHNDPDDIAKEFIETYPEKGRDALMLRIRRYKEDFYSSDKNFRKFNCSIDLGELTGGAEQFSDKYLKLQHKDNNFILNLLGEKNYLNDLKKMLEDFKREIGQNKIHYVYFTGGASNMDFFVEMVCKEYNVVYEKTCTKDKDPSTTISQGIAVLGEATWKWQEEEKKIRDEVEEWKSNRGISLSTNSTTALVNDSSISQFIKNECEKIFQTQIKQKAKNILEKYRIGKEEDWPKKRNVEALESALKMEFNKTLKISNQSMEEISQKINNKFMKEIGDQINNRIAEVWKVKYKASNINISIELSAYLTDTDKKILSQRVLNLVYTGLNSFYGGLFVKTSRTMMKDRWYDPEREKIVDAISNQLNTILLNNISFKFNYYRVMEQVNKEIDNYLDRAISFAKLDTLNA